MELDVIPLMAQGAEIFFLGHNEHPKNTNFVMMKLQLISLDNKITIKPKIIHGNTHKPT